MKKLKELKFKIEYSDDLLKIIGLDKKTSEIEFAVNFTTDEKQFNDVVNKYYNGNKKQFYKEIIRSSHEMLNNN